MPWACGSRCDPTASIRRDHGAPATVSVFRSATVRVKSGVAATDRAPVPLVEVFDVSTSQPRSPVDVVSCRTRPPPRAG
jgi:hypothetical protein